MTQEITTTPAPVAVPASKAQNIRHLREHNPNMSVVEIAKAAGTSEAYVYMTLKASTPKKQKKIEPTKEQFVTDGQKLLRKEITRLHNELDKYKNLNKLQEDRIIFLANKVKNLKDHHSGLEYVISYLESRLGIERKDDGATV